MAATVVDSGNQIEFMSAGKPVPMIDEKASKPDVAAESETKVDEKAVEPQEDEDGLTAEDRERLGAKKYDKVIARRHRLQKEAEEARDEAEAFAQTQYREKRAAESRAAELERQLQSLQTPVVKSEDVAPQRTDAKYKDDQEQYWNDLIDWKSRQAVREDREKRVQEEQQRVFTAETQAFNARLDEAATKHPDFKEVVSAATAEVPNHIMTYLRGSDLGGELVYHFAANQKVFERLVSLSPIKAIAEIGKIEVSLSADKPQNAPEPKIETKPAEKSRAPEPIAPLSGGTGTVHKSLAEMNTKETIEYWQARDKDKQSRRQRH